MTISASKALRLILLTAVTQDDWCALLSAALGSSRRVSATTLTTEFRNCALAGPVVVSNRTITGLGSALGTTVSVAADLSQGVGTARMRITNGANWIEGSIGLTGSGCDFIVSGNPTATNGFALSQVLIKPPSNLPISAPTGDTTAPTVAVTVSSANVSTASNLTVTATPADNIGVARVDFFRNGALIGARTSAPWQAVDPLSYGLNGTLSYTARAFDAAGNNALSLAQQVVVNIAAPIQSGNAVALGAAFTTKTLQNTSASSATNVPFTFGQPFILGQLPASGAAVEFRKADNSVIAAQLDVKATHPDGSVRHAIISALVPYMAASESILVSIVRKAAAGAVATPTAASYVAAGMNATVSIVDSGVTYTATLADLVATATLTPWIAGPVACEWLMHGPLKTAGGAEHPYIHARFYARAYSGVSKAKIDVTLENSWCIPDTASTSGGKAWVQNSPSDVTCDVTVTVPGDTAYSTAALLHNNRARWTRTFWWNAAPALHLRHNAAYLIASMALPNYDQSVVPSPARMASDRAAYLAASAPMQTGLTAPFMAQTGGHDYIGLNPGWTIKWLLTQDKDAKDTMIGCSLLGGSYPVFYRDKTTDKPVSITQYPYACLQIGSSSNDLNPTTGKHEIIPPRVGGAASPNTPNDAHEVNMCYVAYLVTGDYVHLENLQFWNEWNAIEQLPQYRGYAAGLVTQQQIRGMAWLLRTLADVAYISPDGDPIKVRSAAAIGTNLDRLIAAHPNGTDPNIANALGIIHNYAGGWDAIGIYPNPIDTTIQKVAISPWQQDFLCSVFGRLSELGYAKARTMLNWAAKFQVGRLLAPGFCYQHATMYNMAIRNTQTDPLFTSFSQIYQASLPSSILAAACGSQAMSDACATYYGEPFVLGQMQGHSSSDDGYPACQQPAMAYVATSDHPQAGDAWLVFNGRPAKPTYSGSPAFAIIPRV